MGYKGKLKPDKLSLMQYKTIKDSPDKILFQQVILDAANNYMYFGLADKNGTNSKEFWFSYRYFYHIKAADPKTWATVDRTIRKSRFDKDQNKRIVETIELTDEQIKAMCFDTHFNIANIQLSQETFLRWLKRARTEIVIENWENIKTYLKNKQNQPQNQYNYDILTLTDENLIKRILISPESPEELESLVHSRAAEDNNTVKGDHGGSTKNISNNFCGGFS